MMQEITTEHGIFTNNEETGKTAEEVYKEWLESKGKIIVIEPTNEETLSKEVANIKIDNMKKDAIITNALQTIANLKVEVMGMKGGNI